MKQSLRIIATSLSAILLLDYLYRRIVGHSYLRMFFNGLTSKYGIPVWVQVAIAILIIFLIVGYDWFFDHSVVRDKRDRKYK